MNATLTQMEALLPSTAERRLAQDSSKRIANLLKRGMKKHGTAKESIELVVNVDAKVHDTITVPVSSVELLKDILNLIAEGNIVGLETKRLEVSPNQAADYCEVSRPYLVAKIKRGEIPCRMVGNHHRLLFEDVVKFKKQLNQRREDAAARLSEIDEEWDL